MCIYFLCTFVQLKRHPGRKYELKLMTEEQQHLATSEIGHCRAATGEHGEHVNHSGCTLITASMLANEHSFKAQLRTTAFTLFLFVATWTFGALAVSQGHFLDMIFSCLYGSFSVTLGLFLLIQHCAKRDDVWHRWWSCCPSKPKVNANGEAGGSTRIESKNEFQPVCSSKALLSPNLHSQSPQCSLSWLPSAHIPVSPCCTTLHCSSPALGGCFHPQSLHHELPHPTLPLQSCLKDKTKSRSFSRPRPCLRNYHTTSLDGSVHSSHLDSPRSCYSSHPERQLSCSSPHPDHQLHCTSPNIQLKSLASHNLYEPHLDSPPSSHEGRTCHRHGAKVDIFSDHYCPTTDSSFLNASSPENTSNDRLMFAGTKAASKMEDDVLHLDMEPPRISCSQVSRKTSQSRKGTISHDDSQHDDSGNIRTGPWKNETTV